MEIVVAYKDNAYLVRGEAWEAEPGSGIQQGFEVDTVQVMVDKYFSEDLKESLTDETISGINLEVYKKLKERQND